MSKTPVRTRFLYILIPVLFALVGIVLGCFLLANGVAGCSSGGCQTITFVQLQLTQYWFNPGPLGDATDANGDMYTAYWGMVCAAVIFLFLLLCLGFVTPYKNWLNYSVWGIAILSALLTIAAAGVVTSLSSDLVNTINNAYDQAGITAHLDAQGMGVVWGMAAATTICAVIWPFCARSGTFSQH